MRFSMAELSGVWKSRGSLAARSASLMMASITGWKPLWPCITAREHHVLGQLLGLGLDHQHGVGGAGDHEVERLSAISWIVGFSLSWPLM